MSSFQARAVIFDLDGVLVDSEPLCLAALNRILVAEGAHPITEEENRPLFGTTVEYTWDAVKEMRSLPRPVGYYLELYGRVLPGIFEEELVLQPGALRAVQAVRARMLPLGLATSSRRKWVEVTLKVVGLGDAFDAIVT